MKSVGFALLLTLSGCTVNQRRAMYLEAISVSVAVSQAFAGSQGTGISVGVIPVWQLKPAQTRLLARTTVTVEPMIYGPGQVLLELVVALFARHLFFARTADNDAATGLFTTN